MADYLRLKVFEPAGMRSTWPTNTQERCKPRHRLHGQRPNARSRQLDGAAADGAFLSTVTDLAKWEARLYTDTPLPEATRRDIWTPVTLTDSTTHPLQLRLGLLEPLNGRRQYTTAARCQGFISKARVRRRPRQRPC